MENYYQNFEYDYEASASSKPINLKLIFSNDVVNSPVFTKQNITGKNGGNESMKVILIDANTQQQVTKGPEAFAKVKIALVHGNYDGTTMEDGEFEKNIVVNWYKKKNLLQGDKYVYLKHGSGTIGEIRIKHDKHPIKNVEFRLGAMVVDCSYKVKEGLTQSFKVKDLRNAPKSFRSLLLTDKVWQLINISKYGVIHKRLERENVFTVMDFLNMYHFNRQNLQEVYGSRGKKWETTVNHAKTCVGNDSIRFGSTSQGSNTMPSSFDDDCYTPQPYENDSYGKEMIVDASFSIHDVQCDMDVWFRDHGGICGASTMVGHVEEGKGVKTKAKKRWIKMRTLLFSIASFMCGCDVVG